MRKLCDCGQSMTLGFRLVILDNKYQIDRVPIFECDDCEKYEVLPMIKNNLKNLMAELKERGQEGRVHFSEVNDFGYVLYESYKTWEHNGDIQSFEVLFEQGCEARINHLLDLYSYAKKANDQNWMNEISDRLASLSEFAKERQFMNTNSI